MPYYNNDALLPFYVGEGRAPMPGGRVDGTVALCHYKGAKPIDHNVGYAAEPMNAKPKPQERPTCAAPLCSRAVPASRGARAKTCSKACGAALRAMRMRAYNKASKARARAARAIAHDTRAPQAHAQTAAMPAPSAADKRRHADPA